MTELLTMEWAEHVDRRLDNIELRLDNIELRLDSITSVVTEMYDVIKDHTVRLDRLEAAQQLIIARLERLEAGQQETNRLLTILISRSGNAD